MMTAEQEGLIKQAIEQGPITAEYKADPSRSFTN